MHPLERYRVAACAPCTRCKQQVPGWIAFDAHHLVVDSGNFVLFGDGPMCEPCRIADMLATIPGQDTLKYSGLCTALDEMDMHKKQMLSFYASRGAELSWKESSNV